MIQFAPNYLFRAVLAAIILFLFFSIVYIFTHFYILYHILVLVTFLLFLTCFNIFMLIKKKKFTHLKMTSERSKRRDFFALVFISKSISKKLLIKIIIMTS